jgi:hypothetical protein
MYQASIEHAEDDLQAAQVAQARVDADAILMAIDKAKRNEAWSELTSEERQQIESAIRQLQSVYHENDHHRIREKIDVLNHATHHLAESMMNTAVSSALKGTKV